MGKLPGSFEVSFIRFGANHSGWHIYYILLICLPIHHGKEISYVYFFIFSFMFLLFLIFFPFIPTPTRFPNEVFNQQVFLCTSEEVLTYDIIIFSLFSSPLTASCRFSIIELISGASKEDFPFNYARFYCSIILWP